MTRCDGRIVRVHLLPKQLLRRHDLDPYDIATYVFGCGGPTGIGGHHGELDTSRVLWIPFEALPPRLLHFARRHDLWWYIEREFVSHARWAR